VANAPGETVTGRRCRWRLRAGVVRRGRGEQGTTHRRRRPGRRRGRGLGGGVRVGPAGEAWNGLSPAEGDVDKRAGRTVARLDGGRDFEDRSWQERWWAQSEAESRCVDGDCRGGQCGDRGSVDDERRDRLPRRGISPPARLMGTGSALPGHGVQTKGPGCDSPGIGQSSAVTGGGGAFRRSPSSPSASTRSARRERLPALVDAIPFPARSTPHTRRCLCRPARGGRRQQAAAGAQAPAGTSEHLPRYGRGALGSGNKARSAAQRRARPSASPGPPRAAARGSGWWSGA